MSYSDLLKDPRWQRKRLEILERDEWMCQNCGTETVTLHVHHGYYAKGRKPWEYENESLRTLCEDCHADVTVLMADLNRTIALMWTNDVAITLGFAIGRHAVGEDWNIPLNLEDAERRMGVAFAVGMRWKDLDELVAEHGGVVTMQQIYDRDKAIEAAKREALRSE